jgi:hypothetical protein
MVHIHVCAAYVILSVHVLLQPEVAQEACRSACDHIAKSVLGFMLSEDVKQISMGALQQVNLDTIQCERT